MTRPSTGEQILDMFLLRTKEPDYAIDRPYYTTGSIVTAAIFRVAIIGVAAMIYNANTYSDYTWYITLFLIWGVGVYPAYIQYQRFNEHIERISEETLCGKCRYFNPTNQLCTILDEHVTDDYVPCGGEAWEPRGDDQ